MKLVLLVLAMLAYAYALPTYKECDPNAKKCEFWLVVKEALTMVAPGKRGTQLVKAKNGKLVPPVALNTVITADGIRRMVIAINGTLPGPPLVVYEGQQLIIHLKNAMISDTLTMHWHGMYQYGTNFMDGVPFITQCPIIAGQSFTYKFKAEPKGTHWYHSHVGAQRTNGVAGALIVKEKPDNKKVYPQEAIMTVGEWEHEPTEHSFIKMKYGNFKDNGERVDIPKTVDGGNFSPIPWISGLIDGKGRYTDPHTGKSTETPLQWYHVKKGEKYRFRVIHTGAQYPVRISVDGHDLEVVATDGHEIKPQTVESFIINAGERFDFMLTCDELVENYWIRAVSLEVSKVHHSVEAILSYNGAKDVEPTTKRRECTPKKKCKVLNCIWNIYPTSENIQCILMGDVKGNENTKAPEWKADSKEHFLNFVIPFTRTGLKSIVNGKIFNSPMVAAASQANEIDPAKDCSRSDCGENKICSCNHELEVPYGKTIQMVWLNMGSGAHGSHPIHLHGHSFYVLKTVFAAQDPKTGHRIEATELVHPDIDCGSNMVVPRNGKMVSVTGYCNKPQWKNQDWKNGKVPGLNLLNPPRKDTVMVPNGGYVVVRINSDNPGKWFMHCHIEVHAIDGMALTLAEGMNHLGSPPRGFPLCNNFYNDPKKDVYRSNEEVHPYQINSEDCWGPCKEKRGRCDYCGYNGYCCRKYSRGCPRVLSQLAGRWRHTCIRAATVTAVPTIDGNAGGAHCVFPFTVGWKIYYSCTKDGFHQLWCATTSNYLKDRKWGFCIIAKGNECQQQDTATEVVQDIFDVAM